MFRDKSNPLVGRELVSFLNQKNWILIKLLNNPHHKSAQRLHAQIYSYHTWTKLSSFAFVCVCAFAANLTKKFPDKVRTHIWPNLIKRNQRTFRTQNRQFMPKLGPNKARVETSKKNGYRSSPILKTCSDLPWLDLTTYMRLDHIGSGDDGGCIIQSVYHLHIATY